MKTPLAAMFIACLVALSLAACSRHEEKVPVVLQSVDRWLGTWTGPEGTSLRIDGEKGNYQITITNLDGPRTFRAAAVDGTLRFERDGKTESLSQTTGAKTGMKWLVDKHHCLIVRTGEGYCRD